MVLQPRALLLGSPGLACSDFARHYFRNHGCFLFLWVLRWFTSPGSLHHPMNSGEGNRCSHLLGSPIRKSPDHRLLASPRGLSLLATSFIASSRQGIHTHALSSLTIKFTLNTRAADPAPPHSLAVETFCFCQKKRQTRAQASLVFKCPSDIQLSKIKPFQPRWFFNQPAFSIRLSSGKSAAQG